MVIKQVINHATLSASHWLVGNENDDAMTTVATNGRSSVWNALGACLCADLRVYTERHKHLSVTA